MKLFFSRPSFRTLLIRGLLIVIVGSVGVLYPALFSKIILSVIGAVLIVSGASSFLQLRKKDRSRLQIDLIFSKGIINLLIGLTLIVFPYLFTSFILFIVGFIIFFAGLMQMSMFTANRKSFGISYVGMLIPFLITAVGAVILFRPHASSLGLTRLVAAVAVLYGAWELVLAIRLKQKGTDDGGFSKFEEVTE